MAEASDHFGDELFQEDLRSTGACPFVCGLVEFSGSGPSSARVFAGSDRNDFECVTSLFEP